MKNLRILRAIGQVNDDYITEAIPHKKATKKLYWIKWGALASCLTLATFTVIKMIPSNSLKPTGPQLNGLPMLTITEDLYEGMGFEGYIAYDISEIVNNNPWNESMEVSTLPVFKSTLSYGENHRVIGGNLDKMKDFLINIARRLNMDIDNLEITDDAPSKETQSIITKKLEKAGKSVSKGYFTPSYVKVKDSGIEINVDQQMTATISFSPSVTLPDEYTFTHYASYNQVAAVANYLKESYKDFIGMDNPQINIYGGDYSIFSDEESESYGSQQAKHYAIEFYDGSEDTVSQIINYNFNRVAFYCDDDGKLFIARVFQPDLSDQVGDYPIITTDAAKELLKKGNYFTTVPEKLPGLVYVAKVELIYRPDVIGQYLIPYYRFYVELRDMETENGLKTYGAYYVPAVQGEYISNMPVWGERFN